MVGVVDDVDDDDLVARYSHTHGRLVVSGKRETTRRESFERDRFCFVSPLP